MQEGNKVHKSSIVKNLFRILFWVILALFIILGTLIFCTLSYLESNERKIIKNIPFLDSTELSFGETDISLFKNFPHATATVNDIAFSYPSSGSKSLQLTGLNANLKLNLKDWRTKELVVNEVVLQNGSLNIIQSENQEPILSQLLNQVKNQVEDEINKNTKSISISSDKLKIQLNDIDIDYLDETKESRLAGTINYLEIDNINLDSLIKIENLDCYIKELTFDKNNGSYLKSAHIKSKKIELENTDNGIVINPTILNINDQQFGVSSFISTSKKATTIRLKNNRTNLNTILPLLPSKIAREIKPYRIEGQFPTETKLKFSKNNPALVEVNFELADNEINIENQKFDSASLTGQFINRQNSSKGIALNLYNFKSNSGSFILESDHININSSPIQKASIDADIIVSGSAEELNRYYNSDKFLLTDGSFSIKGHINGPLKNLGELLEESSLDLEIEDINVNYNPAKISIPIQAISLTKDSNQTDFIIKSTTLKSGYPYQLEGQLINLTSLISDYTETTTTSEILLKADRMGWSDFVSVFSKNTNKITKKTEQESKSSMKSTLHGINDKFKPKISIEIDTFHYFDLIDLYDLKTGAYFNEDNLLVLDTTYFKIDQGNVTAQSVLDISHPSETSFDIHLNADNLDLSTNLPRFDFFNISVLNDLDSLPDDFNLDVSIQGKVNDVTGLIPKTLHGQIKFDSKQHENINGVINFDSSQEELRTQLDISGNPKLFNEIFNNDQFIFQDAGSFKAAIHHRGEIISLEELIEFSTTSLVIDDGAVYYKDVDVIFPLSDLELNVLKDTARLDLYMYSDILDREISIEGVLENASALIVGNQNKTLTTKLNATSPLINLSHAIDIFQYPPDTSAVPKPHIPTDQKMKNLINKLFKRFQPDLHLELDTFIITDKITLTDLKTGAELIDSTYFVLDSSNFDFNGGNVKLNMQIDVSQENEEPFETELKTTNLDLASSLEALKYLGSRSLREAKLIEGRLDMNLNFKGSVQNLKLITAQNDGTINFTLNNLKLKGIDVIDDISYKIYSPGIFDDLEFAPLTNTFRITKSRIDIPQMEIQSNEVDFFVEGHIDNLNETNMWLSIPLDNLKRKNKASLDSRGYDATKRKIHLEISPNKKGDIKTKFRFRKKKFYKQRGLEWKI